MYTRSPALWPMTALPTGLSLLISPWGAFWRSVVTRVMTRSELSSSARIVTLSYSPATSEALLSDMTFAVFIMRSR